MDEKSFKQVAILVVVRLSAIFLIVLFEVLLLHRFFSPDYTSLLTLPSRLPTYYERFNNVSNGVESSCHDEYENSWIMDVDGGEVLVQLMDRRDYIIFRPSVANTVIFKENIGNVAGVTFECEKDDSDKCNLSQAFRLCIGNVYVELVEIIEKPVIG